ncbi:MAG: exodeoxyribonuclease VII small subunit [Calditrichaeota bacterium]|nr:MAG: exodeoxyribonuclease VII small subunit [Calditrichota bacterium]
MPKKKTFEQAMSRLDDITALLENGELPLDESIRLYEEAFKLMAFCRKELDNAEQKIRTITESGSGALQYQDFE